MVIEAQYACADAFENGKARVATDCTHMKDGEYTSSKSDHWTWIDKTGNEVK